MWRYMVATLALLSPIIATFHALLFKAWSPSFVTWAGDQGFVGQSLCSLTINVTGVLAALIGGWFVGRFWTGRKKRHLRESYASEGDGKGLAGILTTLRQEIIREIERYEKCKETKRKYDDHTWETLKNLFSTTRQVSSLGQNESGPECRPADHQFVLIGELRRSVFLGLVRLEEILTGERTVFALHRADEVLKDLLDNHIPQLQTRMFAL